MKENQIAILKKQGQIGLIQLDNPPQNYLESPVFIDLTKVEEVVSSGIKGLVITGTGRHFSAGANIASIKGQLKEKARFELHYEQV